MYAQRQVDGLYKSATMVITQCCFNFKSGIRNAGSDTGGQTRNFPQYKDVEVDYFTSGTIALTVSQLDAFNYGSNITGLCSGVMRIYMFSTWYVLPLTGVWVTGKNQRFFYNFTYSACSFDSQSYIRGSTVGKNFGSFSRSAILNRKHGKKPKTETSDAQAPACAAAPSSSGYIASKVEVLEVAISCRVFEKSALSRVDLGDIAPAMDSENFAS